jgi:hypothetical protein
MMQYTFEVQAPGASPLQIARSVASVMRHFADAGFLPWEAAQSAKARALLGAAGFPPEGQLSEAQLEAAELWDEVPDLLRAGCYGRTEGSPAINFRLVHLEAPSDP